MATVIPVPTLSTEGFVTDLSGKLDFLLSHFFLSENNQTHLYHRSVISLPEIIQRAGGDASRTIEILQQALSSYMSAYYPAADVQVSSRTDLETDPSIKVELHIRIDIRENNAIGSFDRLVLAENSKFSSIIALNNG